VSIALYRRYRPETFADVIGQEHVTEPLMQALRSGRVNHAYLFSGPRGCGKTTSARILARCLNCEQGPTPEPCGTCESCVALARDGAGSVDVIEIDAASHGRVDDTRELRERAAFGPATARYKIYIIDEAHMVSREGFNSLLKIVEEPPPHVKFIFATTEPEKVLATIRSRTHHYPFHLVPPQRLTAYLEQLCESEGVRLEPGVLSFVTRAGGGSVRDSLSVLDQLISGAGEAGLTYERTAALLGFTDVELLDAVVEAVAAGDAATVFAQIDRVMESGHDPRRFVEDLLERYRDLIVLAATGEQAGGLLPGLPEDQIDRMRRQAQSYGAAGLSRAGDLVSRGLSEMTGAVSYRLMLELMAARLLLPGAQGDEGHGARLDRIERRLGAGGEQGGVGPTQGDTPGTQGPVAGGAAPVSARRRASAAVRGADPGAADASDTARGPQGAPAGEGQEPGGARVGSAEQAPTSGTDETATAAQAPGHLDTAAMRRHWPDIITAVRAISRRTAGALESIQVVDFDGRRLLVGMPDDRWIRHFMGTSNEEALRQGVLDALALDTTIEATVLGAQAPAPVGAQSGSGSGSGSGSAAGAGTPRGAAPAPADRQRPGEGDAPPAGRPPQGGSPQGRSPQGGGGSADGGRPAQGDQPAPGARGRQPSTGPGGRPGHAGSSAPEPPDDDPEPPADEPPEPDDWAPPADLHAATTPAAPARSTGPTSPAQTSVGATPPTRVPDGIPDAPMRGRLRTRSGGDAAGDAGSTSPSGPAPVRVRGRGDAAGPRGGAEQAATAGEPGLAEQLGAGGRPSAPSADQPDWSQRAGQGAPAWATGGEPSTAPTDSTAEAQTPAEGAVDGSAADARSAASPGTPRVSPPPPPPRTPGGDAPSADDEDLATSGAVGQPVIESVLGGTVIAINDDPVA